MSSIEYINSVVLTVPAANVEFTNIPSTYTDLRIVALFRSTRSNTLEGLRFGVNSDSGSNYSRTSIVGDGSTVSSTRNSSQTYITGLQCAGGTNTAYTPMTIDFLSYANASVHKTFLIAQGTNGGAVISTVGLWRSSSAITSILLFPESGPNWDTGSTFTLWGIK